MRRDASLVVNVMFLASRNLTLLCTVLGGCTEGEIKAFWIVVLLYFAWKAFVGLLKMLGVVPEMSKAEEKRQADIQNQNKMLREEAREECRAESPGAFEFNQAVPRIYAGMVFSGHPEIPQLIHLDVGCTEQNFAFMREGGWSEVGKIPRNAITDLEVLSRSRVETDSRFTLTRIALLGVFALAVPKKTTKHTTSYMLQVGILHKGVRIPTYFGSRHGLEGLNTLMKYFADNMHEASIGETKPCPFCAEPIRAAAVKCRYCGSMLGPGELRL